MQSPTLEEKIAFFDQLEALDHVDDDDDHNAYVDEKEQNHRDQCRAFFRSLKKPKHGPAPTSVTAAVSASSVFAPTPAATARDSGVIKATPAPLNTRDPTTRGVAGIAPRLTGAASFIEETPMPETARPPPAALRPSTTLPLPRPTSPSTSATPAAATAASSSPAEPSPSTATAMRKRKRQSLTKSAPTVPESAQIFRGLAFYYIPNNDIAPARKLRIAKAQEYGAQWVRNLADATHVVVDKHLEYKDMENLVGPEPSPSLVIVNEEYPIDSVSFRTLLNPDQVRYRVSGCPATRETATAEELPPVPLPPSDRSLQIKPLERSRRRGSGASPPEVEEPSLQGDVRDSGEASRPQTAGPSCPPAPAPVTHTRPASPPPQADMAPTNPGPAPRPGSTTNDELSQYIELIQQYKHLPLDADEDDAQSVKDAQEAASDSEIEEGSADERKRKRSTRTRRPGQKAIPFEERFACNRGGTKDKSADTQNPNAKTIEVLHSMCDYYTRINDHWRTLAYRKAIATLRRQPTKVMTEEVAFQLPNVGARIAAKIEEIASTNKLRRLEYANDEPLDQVLETFLKIYDVGTSRANKWIAQGFRTLDDLRQKADLTTNQRLGIERYDDLNTRIPRAEIAALFAYVEREAAQIDPSVELLVGGSYRRGSDSSGDIDIIVTRKGTDSSADLVPFLEELVAILTRKGFLVAVLAALHANRLGKDGPGSKWHGCCVLPAEGGAGGEAPRQIWRRIDFLLVPESEYGAALIYFTGNDIFNRSMRLLASKKGMRLNQRGLYKEVMRGKNRIKVTEGELMEGRDEKRIFELLGVKWREPWERWC
ncbi:hypothetical protein C8A05DRAFT_17002 [Staphylotrichum tortipilum]|uniref:DNA polymerase lambda n=1 Tax=Staphylotrichum tortipilum TaxID=2831512 RepID=A0AAN6MIG0_9PEZI|nr:hypothetical protein C8A05DRAFT_17002 [Staphylotrichum longicolle]